MGCEPMPVVPGLTWKADGLGALSTLEQFEVWPRKLNTNAIYI